MGSNTLEQLQSKLDTIAVRERRAIARYDASLDGSDAKFRAQQDLVDISKEKVQAEEEINRECERLGY